MVYLLKKLFCIVILISLSFENNIDFEVEGVKVLIGGLFKVFYLENLFFYDVNRKIDVVSEIFRIIFIVFGEVFVYCLKLIRLDFFVNLLY